MQRWWQEGELGNESKSTLWMDKGVNEGFSHWDLELRCSGELLSPVPSISLSTCRTRTQGAWDTHSGRKSHFLGNGSALTNSCVLAPKGVVPIRILRNDREHKPFPAPR